MTPKPKPKPVRAWAVTLYDGTGIYGQAGAMSIFGNKSEALYELLELKDMYGKDEFCKIKIIRVEIRPVERKKKRKAVRNVKK